MTADYISRKNWLPEVEPIFTLVAHWGVAKFSNNETKRGDNSYEDREHNRRSSRQGIRITRTKSANRLFYAEDANGCDHGKYAPHVGQILVSLVISFPQWQMNVPIAMRLPTMISGMPTIAPTTVQQSSMPIT
jgi:hypothetical protein